MTVWGRHMSVTSPAVWQSGKWPECLHRTAPSRTPYPPSTSAACVTGLQDSQCRAEGPPCAPYPRISAPAALPGAGPCAARGLGACLWPAHPVGCAPDLLPIFSLYSAACFFSQAALSRNRSLQSAAQTLKKKSVASLSVWQSGKWPECLHRAAPCRTPCPPSTSAACVTGLQDSQCRAEGPPCAPYPRVSAPATLSEWEPRDAQ